MAMVLVMLKEDFMEPVMHYGGFAYNFVRLRFYYNWNFTVENKLLPWLLSNPFLKTRFKMNIISFYVRRVLCSTSKERWGNDCKQPISLWLKPWIRVRLELHLYIHWHFCVDMIWDVSVVLTFIFFLCYWYWNIRANDVTSCVAQPNGGSYHMHNNYRGRGGRGSGVRTMHALFE